MLELLNYGYSPFFARCAAEGVDGIIIPDLPYEEKSELAEIAKEYGVDLISLITPTSEQRIKQIASDASGFVYVVSSMGVTGMRSEIQSDLTGMLELVRASTTIPAAVGFGINNPQQAREIAKLADGVIVGSAIVKIIEKHGDNAGPYIFDYVRSMRAAIMG